MTIEGGNSSLSPPREREGPAQREGEGENAPLFPGGLYKLTAWLSPSFPVGAYSYSHGIEYAVEAGLVRDAAGLTGWLATIIAHGAGRIDAALFLAAHRAVLAGDDAALAWAAERGDVLRGTAETALESSAQGTAFLATLRAAWPDPRLDRWAQALDRPPAYAVAAGVSAALSGIGEEMALALFLQAVAANLISAAVRIIPLGQTDGQRVTAALEAPLLAAARAALDRPLEDLGAAAPMVDWTSMTHETQYTRLFRS